MSVSQDDFGGDIVDPEGAAQESTLDPEGNVELPSSQDVASGLRLDDSAQQGEAKASLIKTSLRLLQDTLPLMLLLDVRHPAAV